MAYMFLVKVSVVAEPDLPPASAAVFTTSNCSLELNIGGGSPFILQSAERTERKSIARVSGLYY